MTATLVWALGVAGVVIAGALLMWRWATRLRRSFDAGDRANAAGQQEAAAACYGRAVKLFESGPRQAMRQRYLTALVALGGIQQDLRRTRAAFEHYRKAQQEGAKLPEKAIQVLAECQASDGVTTSAAVEDYLAYAGLGFLRGGKVLEVAKLLEKVCTITDQTPAAERALALQRCRRLIAACDEFEWAHYYSAIAFLDDGHPDDAVSAMVRAGQLNPGRALTHHWRIFQRAHAAGARLLDPADRLVAECLAETGTTDEDAIGYYLRYIRVGPFKDERARRVLELLQRQCDVSEKMRGTDRHAAAERCIRVIAANPGLEWAHYFLGLARLLSHSIEEAQQCFEKSLSLNPRRPMTYYWLGVCGLERSEPNLDGAIHMIDRFLEMAEAGPEQNRFPKRQAAICARIGQLLVDRAGGFDAAVGGSERKDRLTGPLHYFNVAVERHGDSAEYHYLFGRTLASCGDAGRALTHLERAAALSPKDKRYQFQLGLELVAAGRFQEAIGSLEAVLEQDPADLDALSRVGELRFRAGRYERAEQDLRGYLGRAPSPDSRFYGIFVRALYAQGKYQSVILEVGKAPAACRRHLEEDREAAFEVARTYGMLGLPADAIPWYMLAGDSPATRYYIGCAQARLGNHTEALDCLGSVAAAAGEFQARGLIQCGHVNLARGDEQSAEADYLEAASIEPGNREVHYAIGVLCGRRKDYREAQRRFLRSLEIQPDPRSRFALAVTLEHIGEAREALGEFGQLRDDGRWGQKARLRSTLLHYGLGEYGEALKDLEGVDFRPEFGDIAAFWRGAALYQTGRFEDAIRQWDSLLGKHPGDAVLVEDLGSAWLRQGVAQARDGRFAEAAGSLQQCLRLCPQDETASRELGKIEFRRGVAALRNDGAPDFQKAAGHFAAAMAAGDTGAGFYDAICSLYLGLPDECLQKLEPLAASGAPRERYHLGLCLLYAGREDEALRVLGEVASSSGDGKYRRYAAWALGNELIRNGRYEDATGALQLAAGQAAN
jgi:tetratricopeptide (TPR) repeat protein